MNPILVRTIKVSECHFQVKVEPEDLDPAKLGYDPGVVNDIEEARKSGDIYSWAYVTVVARIGELRGEASLGALCYASEQAFLESDEYSDLQRSAVDNLNERVTQYILALAPFLQY